MRCRNHECPLHRDALCEFVQHGRRRDVPVLVAYLQQPERKGECPLLERLRIAAAHQSLESDESTEPFRLLAALGSFQADENTVRALRHLQQALNGVLVRRQSHRAPQQHCGTCRSFGPFSQLCLRTTSSDPLSTRLGRHAHFGAALTPDQDPSGLFPPCRSHDPRPEDSRSNDLDTGGEMGRDRSPLFEALLALAAEDPLGARLFEAVVLQSEDLGMAAQQLEVPLDVAELAFARATDRWRELTANLFRHERAS